jgi:hypothetical protein
MTDNAPKSAAPIQWKWVFIGVLVGVIIMSLSYAIVGATFHNTAIRALVILVGFILTGTIVGYYSPGVTIREAAFAGIFSMVIMAAMINLFEWEAGQQRMMIYLLLLLGGALAQVGGWIGEKLQGSIEDKDAPVKRFEIKWVLVGTFLGLVLNVLFAFLLAPLFNINMNLIFIAFSISFVVTGFIVGYKSPGVTIKEPAVAGLIAVFLEWIFIQFALALPVPIAYLAFGLFEGFILTLVGAWLGEKLQSYNQKTEEDKA